MSVRNDWSVAVESLPEFAAQLALEQAELLTGRQPVAVIELPAAPRSCPTCGGVLISEVSAPSSARCVSCGEPVRRIT